MGVTPIARAPCYAAADRNRLMTKLCTFTDAFSEKPVSINPHLVRAVAADLGGAGTSIRFNETDVVSVVQNYDAIVKALENADRP
jgi:hypothetical protein